MIKEYVKNLYVLEKNILEIYDEIIKREICKEDKIREIKILKKLEEKEKKIYCLTYEELKKMLILVEKEEKISFLIKQRIIRLINLVIDKKYLKEELNSKSDVKIMDDEEFEIMDDEDIEMYIKEDAIIKSSIRDLIFLKLKRLNKKIKEINDNDIKRGLIIYKYKLIYLMKEIEDEILERNFEINDFYLINKLAKEFSRFDKIDIRLIEKEFTVVEFNSFDKLMEYTDKDLIDSKRVISIIKKISELEAEYIFSGYKYNIIKRCESNIKNDNKLIIEIIKTAIYKINLEEEREGYLTLKRKK